MNKIHRLKDFTNQAACTSLTAAVAVVIAMSLLLISCMLTGYDARETIGRFFLGPVEDGYSIGEILLEALPLLFTGTAVALMNRCGQFNMFVEGGFFVGAFAAGALAPILPEWPVVVPLLCMMAAALVAGTLGTIPALMKSRLNADEFVTSLLLNYIVFWIVMYLLHGPAGDPDTVNKTRYLEDYMKLPYLNEDIRLSSGMLIAIAVCGLFGVFLYRTKWGFAIRTTGDNPKFASYTGINVKNTVTWTQVLGAAIAGLGGAVLLLGNYYRFEWTSLPNYGFDGFVVAIIAGNNPLYVPLASVFLAYLRVGALQTSRIGSVPNELIYVIQAIMIILFGAKTISTMMKRRRGKE